jgi:tetratricopeptide (TPR) repeat protein
VAHFIQYHNCARLGWVPLDDRPFLATSLGVYTRHKRVLDAVGDRVFLIASLGRAARYYLWETFRIEHVRPEGADYFAWGPGWQLVPPQRLQGEEFDAFRKACANFVTFRAIDDLPYCAALGRLADQYHLPDVTAEAERFCDELLELQPASGNAWFYRGVVRQRLGRPAEAVADLDQAVRRNTEFLAQAQACRQRALDALGRSGE